MLVTSLEEMEAIVKSREDLSWKGWDIVKHTSSNNALYALDGEFHQGAWMKKKVFPLTEEGWFLPNIIGRDHAQVEG